MQYNLNTKNLRHAFSGDDIELIRWQFLSAAEHANRFLPTDRNERLHVDFWVVRPYPLSGVGACAPEYDHMKVYLHPDTFYLRNNKNNGRERFSAYVGHERHHNVRRRSQGCEGTLGKVIIREGLAMKFQRETGHADFPEERALRGEALHAIGERAKPLLDRPIPEYGEPDAEVASVEHYLLGLPLVESWSRYSGITAAAAHNIPAQDILAPWLAGKFQISSTPYAPR